MSSVSCDCRSAELSVGVLGMMSGLSRAERTANAGHQTPEMEGKNIVKGVQRELKTQEW